MQKLLKKSIAGCTAFALAASMAVIPVGAVEAQASELEAARAAIKVVQSSQALEKNASKKASDKTTAKKKAKKKAYMAKLKLNWSLKKNKKLAITEPYARVGAKPSQLVMKNYKVKNAPGKPGYKMVTFDLISTLKWKLTPEDVHKIMNTNYYVETQSPGGGVFIAVVDRATGKNLALKNADGTAANKYDVLVNASTWEPTKYGREKTKYVSDELRCHALALYKQTKIHIAITFPKTYKNLVIGVGGFNRKTETKADAAFWAGTGAFGKTSYYKDAKTKKGKKLNSYWMRVK